MATSTITKEWMCVLQTQVTIKYKTKNVVTYLILLNNIQDGLAVPLSLTKL